MKRVAWSKEEDARVLELRAKGRTMAQIGIMLKRPAASCESRHSLLTGHRAKPKANPVEFKRCCLVCRQWFSPQHKRQYIHERCRVRDASPFETSAHLMTPAQSRRAA